MDIVNTIVEAFSTEYNEETQEHTFTLASFLSDHLTTAAFGFAAIIFAISAIKQLRALGVSGFNVFNPSLLNETRSSLSSSIIMFISYSLSSLGMHVFSIFNTGEPTGRELYLSYVVMDSLTLMAVLFSHVYMRIRYSFLSEVFCVFMILSSALHMLLYIFAFYPPVSHSVSWAVYDFVAAFYIITLNLASYLCAFCAIFPDFSLKCLAKLKQAYRTAKSFILAHCLFRKYIKKGLTQ